MTYKQNLTSLTTHKGHDMKLWELEFYDNGVYCTEYHYGVTRMQATGNVIRRLKREVKFEVARVVAEEVEGESV